MGHLIPHARSVGELSLEAAGEVLGLVLKERAPGLSFVHNTDLGPVFDTKFLPLQGTVVPTVSMFLWLQEDPSRGKARLTWW